MIAKEEESTEQILNKIEDLKIRLKTPGNVLYDLYKTDSPKKDAIIKWGEYLEELHERGHYKEPLTKISSTIRVELKSLGLIQALIWANEVLPFKYKDQHYSHKEIPPVATFNNATISSKPLAQDCVKANAFTLKRLAETIFVLTEFKKKLETEIILDPAIPEEKLSERMLRWDASINHLKEVLDGREKVTPATQHLLIFARSTETLSHTYSTYVTYVKEFSIITAKQIGKIVKGRTTSYPVLYEPRNRQQAMEQGFHGSQCGECGNWRVDYKFNFKKNVFECLCYACHTWQKIRKVNP